MKITYRYEFIRFLSDEDKGLSEEELKDKYFEEHYENFRMLKDNGLLNPYVFAKMKGMSVEEEELGEREEIRKIKTGDWGDI